jgi:hypothetical protein
MAHACILPSQEVEIKKMVLKGHPLQKIQETASQQTKLGTVMPTCHPSYCGKHKKKICHPSWLGKKTRPYLKNNHR